jgi:serine/threonine-protein kinase
MGKVYKAHHVALDKTVVLKVLRHSLLSDERTVARFKREAKAASRLNHPNSISILDFGQVDDGALFIAMEFVPGQDLHTVLSKDGPLPEARIVRVISQVLSALSDAHRAGVIHRDLKPENIMVEQRRTDSDFVKVLDFGIAKIQDSSGDDGPALTRTGFVCGTPEYMSPEQARGSPLDHRSDLYAVGVILYQLVTGRLPFESDSAVGFATKHLTEEPVPPSRRRPDLRISPAMERVIMRALAKNPDDRPADAEAFKAELLAVVEKDRRAPPPARRAPNSGVLAPLPRRVTPGDSISTEIHTEPGWSESEATVRAVPERMQSAAPRPPPERTQTNSSPGRSAPPPERAAAAPPRATTERNPAPPVPTVSIEEKTQSLVFPGPRSGSGFGYFKVITIALILVTIGVAGSYLYASWRNSNTKAPFVPPPNAPLPGSQTSGSASPTAEGAPLYEQEIPASSRDEQAAERHARLGDEAFQRGDFRLAASEYKNAFLKNPTPELSLKLGEVYWQRGFNDEARGWWRRHLRDLGGSKARPYILEALPELSRQADR